MSSAHVITGIREHYAADKGAWVVFTEVRSATGFGRAEPRYVDCLAVNVYPSHKHGLETHGIEVKISRADFMHELDQPDKAEAIKQFCDRWYLAVPAPWKRVVHSTHELPAGWGLIEIGTGKPNVVKEAPALDAIPWTNHFRASVLRCSAESNERAAAETLKGDTLDAPMVVVSRVENLRGRTSAILACGHSLPIDRRAAVPKRMRCLACAAGQPVESDLVDAAIRVMQLPQLVDMRDMLDRRIALEQHLAANQGKRDVG